MILEVKVPSPGESVTEVEIGTWLVDDGTVVVKDQEIAEVESDKATLIIVAQEAGKIRIMAGTGDTVAVGAVICTINTEVKPVIGKSKEVSGERDSAPEASVSRSEGEDKEKEVIALGTEVQELAPERKDTGKNDRVKITPLAKELMKKHDISVDDVLNGMKRLGRSEVEAALKVLREASSFSTTKSEEYSREEERKSLTPLRRKLSERLVAVKNETAMLTTFNEIDMGNLMDLRKKYQQQFTEKHGFKLGFMSFFTKAAAIAMSYHPFVNARFEDDNIIIPRFVDVGIAVSTPKGLMVPVVRNAESKTIPQIELEIKNLAEKARSKKISVDELSGGTFTITNGGVFGSLLSTPVINPPQSAILGMHNIVERPVAINGQVVVHPMMYVALSYDHRMIDGRDSVGFLVKIKEFLENPQRLLSGGREPETLLLGL
jgi:2-oxoglutarate dehydrogenase E2 component (dihydrolipoamide succinyltransferase)